MTDTPAIITRPTQTEVNYKSHADERQCQHCRWYAKAAFGGPYCHVVTLTPDAIVPEGSCDRHETLTPDVLMGVAELPPAVSDVVEPAFVDEPVIVETSADGWTATITVPGSAAGLPDGTMVVYEAVEADTVHVDHTVTDDSGKSITGYIKTKITDLFKRNDDEQSSGIKVYGDRWFAWWSNAYEDREQEFFPAKAIDDYIARVDMGIVPYPELWVWHVPGSKHGQADWLGRIGNFAVASGTFDDTPAGRRAKSAYQRKGQRYQMSHGFLYDTAKKQGGVYHQFNTFELTTIPAKAKAAANSFTDFQGVDPMLTPEKKAELETLLGKDVADQLIAQTEAKDKALVEFGVAFKDFVAVDETVVNVETEAAKEAVESASKDFSTLLVDLVGDHAHVNEQVAQMVKAVTAYKAATDATIADFKAQVATLQTQLEDRPRSASKDEATELTPERIKQMTESVDKQSTTIDSFWGTQVRKLE